MDISGITGAQSTQGGTSPAAGAAKSMGKDDFLKLFTTQLRAQDPLNPMDSSAFTAQLAQFSSLEQLTNINTQLTDLLQFQNSLQNTMATGMIGKQVKTTDAQIHTVAGIMFDNNRTYLTLDNGANIQLGDIKEILGGN